jgi:hypothetical protein
MIYKRITVEVDDPAVVLWLESFRGKGVSVSHIARNALRAAMVADTNKKIDQ